ncbi:hypothetical protein [Halarcobacter bivalviorum]|uniref:Lipoprotein n=1 Tax=Halarcobacter bivalviorum TaxID=663364 RepID=A0AAX2AF59_9BACT|nr:hypothetical protein [Halarcobacter bivalviorum]AXH12260.1 hypothetical protein ABIV_1260 [Halarcobacter bivalviorum]RXK11366.1 hypothetical protein CRV05_03060 [Halarcobacter bivalviorum]
MKKFLLSLFAFSFIGVFFISCASNDVVTKEECQALGLKFKKEKVLNFRTGEYEIRSYCKQN